MVLTFLVTCALAAAPVDVAREQLKLGKLDEVLFALDGKTVTGADVPKAAEVLGDAALAALGQRDFIFALQFAQMALKYDGKQPRALEAAARASFAQQEFAAAEGYADKWILAEPANGSARLLRSQLAVEAGEWAVAVDQLDAAKLTGADVEVGKALRAQAQKEVNEKKAALSTVASLEKRLAEATIRAKRGGLGAAAGRAAKASTGITLYGTTWCGYCKKAREYFKRKGIDFTDRDVEKDNGAAEELANKAAAAGVQARGVPVIDVRGKLIVGFDENAIESAL
jgi:glutaredoxin